MAKHLGAFDELVNELISSIVGNTKGITLIEVKKKLVKEYQRLEKKNMAKERAFKVNTERAKGGQGKRPG
ncbi:hypothetical protein PR002_g10606 [Phytophthora rubi]|uniref:Uncharacterized protein n=1 Tax=Phytophthora rubi TaxID=129364 RepID=A0A6A3M6S6_9STRA|nr:hypothetical protein PR002_g10606 [Phytophthora rubi]